MLAYFYESQQNLSAELNQIEIEEPNILKQAERSVYLIRDFLEEWKKYVHENSFKDQNQEIIFFKKIKPEVFSQLIYFTGAYNIESHKPTGSEDFQKGYYLNEIKKIEFFFTEHREFYKYIRNDLTYFDDKYFIRGKFDLGLISECSIYDSDPEFSTTHDCLVSKILANDLLNVYLQSKLIDFGKQAYSVNKNPFENGKYKWTDSKTALVELLYSIYLVKSINNGNVEIKELSTIFEILFSIDLGDVYHEYHQIKDRQNPTKFLDSLRSALLKKIDEQ